MMIDIAKDFGAYPSGRVTKDGPLNGEKFRNQLLIPAIRQALSDPDGEERVVVDIDGVRSFGSSFLEEVFGGLARVNEINVKKAVAVLKIACSKSHLQIFKDAIEQHLQDALKAA